MKGVQAKNTTMQYLWWRFRLKSGRIEKAWGTELRDEGHLFSVWNECICTFCVPKIEVLDRWAQEEQSGSESCHFTRTPRS